ncbi:MAG TPA: pantetheine-phosphate adenylyltransferase [Blastocatellia bacterium]|nr:pantetheine-phosphate adenylyltransferase [Blastocatellia bacterium]
MKFEISNPRPLAPDPCHVLVSLNSVFSFNDNNFLGDRRVTRRAIYPGTFDPITNGHLDIIERSAKLFDEVVVALLLNIEKQPMFSTDERVAMIRDIIRWDNVRVDTFEGLLVHYAVEQQAQVIVRGIRAISDYEYELQMALMNRRMESGVETVFLMAAEEYSYLSSRLIKEVFKLGGSITGLVPDLVERRMQEKIGRVDESGIKG